MLSVRQSREFTGSHLTPTQSCSQLGTQVIGGYVEDAVVHAWQGTNDRQGHKRIQRAGQEQDTSAHLPVRASRWQGSLIHGKRLAWVTTHGPRTVFSYAVITKVFAANYKKVNEFLHWLIKLAIWQEALAYIIVTFAPASDVHAHGDSHYICFSNANNKLIMRKIAHVHRIVTVLVNEGIDVESKVKVKFVVTCRLLHDCSAV